MKPFACDSVLIEAGKVLLIRRATEPFKGEWALPGGRIDKDETPEECVRREMREETSLEVEPVSMIGLYSHAGWKPAGKISAAFLVKKTGGNLKAGPEALEVAWFPMGSLPKLCANHGSILADAVRVMKKD